MTATLSMPKSAVLGMLSKAQTGSELLQILDAVVNTQEDQVPVVDVEDETTSTVVVEDEMPMIDDAYIMENDYNDDFDF